MWAVTRNIQFYCSGLTLIKMSPSEYTVCVYKVIPFNADTLTCRPQKRVVITKGVLIGKWQGTWSHVRVLFKWGSMASFYHVVHIQLVALDAYM